MSRPTQGPAAHRLPARKGLSPATAALSIAFRFVPQRACGSPTTPHMPKHARFGLLPGRSPLLGESLLFSSPAGTKMFHFPAFASLAGWCTSCAPGCPIRTPADHRSFAPTRGFSQLVASFLASGSQGIHRTPLLCLPSLFFLAEYVSLLFPACQRTEAFPAFVENKGVEPLTSCVQSRRSGQLS